AMEGLAKIDRAVFDKTGTLTGGEARLANAHGIDRKTLGLAAALASWSRHPLSRSISAACWRWMPATPDFRDVSELAGFGVEATLGASTYRLGRAAWALNDDSAQGTVLSRDHQELASFQFEDRLREDTVPALEALRKRGIGIEI